MADKSHMCLRANYGEVLTKQMIPKTSYGTQPKMKIHELQEKIIETLNDDETLIQRRCKAYAEESLTVLNDVTQQLQLNKGVAIVVLTPKATGTGRTDDGGIELDCRVSTKCMEIRALMFQFTPIV